MKRILPIFIVVLLLVSGCGAPSETVTVSVEIDCSDILNNYDMLDENLKDEKYVPQDGKILDLTEFKANEGDSALEVLKKLCREKGIALDAESGYAKGINHIYEKSCGNMSGWVYEVNDEPIMSEYTVSEGDKISWIYVCDFSTMSFE